MVDRGEVARTRMNANGRIVIPKSMRRQLGVGPGDEVLLRMEPGGMLVYTLARAVAAIQQELKPYVRDGASVVDELIEDRRAEFGREGGESVRRSPTERRTTKPPRGPAKRGHAAGRT